MNLWRWLWRTMIHEPVSLTRGWSLFVIFFMSPALTGWAFGKGFTALRSLDSAGVEGEVTDGSLTTVLVWATVIAVSEIGRIITLYFGVIEWTRSWTHMETILRGNLLRAQMASGGSDAGRPVASSGEAITYFRDDPHDVVLLADGVLDTMGALLFALIAGAILGAAEPRAALIVVVPLAAVVLVVRSLDTKIKAYRSADRQAASEVSRMVGDLMSGATTVKVNGAIDPVMSRLEKLVRVRETTAVRDAVLDEGVYAASKGASGVALGLVLLVSANSLVSGAFGVGELALFVAYLSWLDFLPRMIGRLLARYKQAGISFDRMSRLVADEDPANTVLPRHLPMDARSGREGGVPPLVVTRPGRVKLQTLELRAFSATYASGAGVNTVSFTLKRGSFTVLTGPIGSGKSTLLRAMLGLSWDTDQAGQLIWNGEPIVDLGAFLVPPNAAFLPQVPQLVSDSLADNVTLGPRDDDAFAGALELASIAEDLEAMPDGIQTMVGPRGLRLSGGQRQRLATARALVHSPELVVLDDLSSALDVETEVELWANLAEAGMTVLAVSYRAVALERADQIIRLEQGRIV